ncbi:MAG: S41 family peptidase [Chloroflexi bacterium]|nr:S41 family peptidase [Chloroflexota bacterium]
MRTLERLILVLLLGSVCMTTSVVGFAARLVPFVIDPSRPGLLTPAEPPEFRIFWEAWGLVEEHFDGSLPDRQTLAHAAIQGMLRALDDPYSFFVEPVDHQLEEAELEGGYGGVGIEDPAELAIQNGRLVIISPRAGSPADRAGIRPGDILLRIDDRSTAGLFLQEAIVLLRGPVGSGVKLTVRRPPQPNPVTLHLVREDIQKATVSWRMLEPGIGYVQISFFSERSVEDLRQALRELKGAGAEQLVLDLRNNPGGIVNAAVQVSSQFIQDGIILIERDGQGNERTFEARGGGPAIDIPLVVLVNAGTASAAEIVAGALQDHGRGPLIGERTFGKGSVQSVHELSDGSSLHVTIARWLTPHRHELEGVGITPDAEIANADGHDRQLEYALDQIRRRVGGIDLTVNVM